MLDYQAAYTYDRYGNRYQSGAQNTGLPYTSVVSAEIDALTNRFKSTTNTLYDAAGQVTSDKKFAASSMRMMPTAAALDSGLGWVERRDSHL